MAVSTNIEETVEGEAPVENKNKKNASILKSFLFQNAGTNVFSMCHFAFKMYRAQAHAQSFLVDTLTLMHHFLAMVDEHSRGKVITIRRRKKNAEYATGGGKKKKRGDSDDELAAADAGEEPGSGDD
jgi:hypothetical protein